MPRDRARRRLLAALRRLDKIAVANIERAEAIRGGIDHLIEGVEDGQPLRELVEAEERPLVTLVTANIEALQRSGVELRRSLAEALRAEGLTMQEIADLFGVTRQRISSLLADQSD